VRIAVITQEWPAFAWGGVGTLSRALARGLHALGADVEVWTRGGGPRARALKAGDAAASKEPYPVLGFDGRGWGRHGFRHWKHGVTKEARRFVPDAVVITTWDPLAGVAAGLRAAGTPAGSDAAPGVRVLAHGRDVTGRLPPEREEVRAAALAGPWRWLALTEWMAARLAERGVSASRVGQLPPAVDTVPSVQPRDAERAAAGPRLLSVGRLIARKGFDTTLQAVAELRRRWPGLSWTVLGDGPERGRLLDARRRLGLDECAVAFRGSCTTAELELAWSAAEVFVLPVREEKLGDTEGYGLVFLEAGVRGLPVVGGRSAGAAEAVVPGRTGLLADPPEDPASVAACVDALLREPARARAMGAAGRARVEAAHTPLHIAAALLADLSEAP
jgi:phosphatidylinositol alpha-1,6-mannosyltransferase